MIMRQGDLIDLNDLILLIEPKEPAAIPSANEPKLLHQAREEFELENILNIMKKNNWKIGKTAEALHIERVNLCQKMLWLVTDKLFSAIFWQKI
ncbi:MAG TPA: hypothetical protein ENN22_09950 [bacterium]|nr:hypothetical protein [bacterium]